MVVIMWEVGLARSEEQVVGKFLGSFWKVMKKFAKTLSHASWYQAANQLGLDPGNDSIEMTYYNRLNKIDSIELTQ